MIQCQDSTHSDRCVNNYDYYGIFFLKKDTYVLMNYLVLFKIETLYTIDTTTTKRLMYMFYSKQIRNWCCICLVMDLFATVIYERHFTRMKYVIFGKLILRYRAI